MLVVTLGKELVLALTCYGQLNALALALSNERHRSRRGSNLRNYVVGRNLRDNHIIVLATAYCDCVTLNGDIGARSQSRLDIVARIVDATHIGGTLNGHVVVAATDIQITRQGYIGSQAVSRVRNKCVDSRCISRCGGRILISNNLALNDRCARAIDLQALVILANLARNGQRLTNSVVLRAVIEDRTAVVGQDKAARRECSYNTLNGIGTVELDISDRSVLLLFLLRSRRSEGLNLTIGGLLALNGVSAVVVAALLNQLRQSNRKRLGNSRSCNLRVISCTRQTILNTNLSRCLGYARIRTCHSCGGSGYVGSLARSYGQHLNNCLSSTKLDIIQTIGIRLTRVAECYGQSLLRSVLGREIERVRSPSVDRVDRLIGIGVRLDNLPSCRCNVACKVLRRYNLELRVVLSIFEVPSQVKGQLLALCVSHVELGHHGISHNLAHRRAVRSNIDILRAVFIIGLTEPAQISICGPACVGRSEGPLAAGINLIVLDTCEIISEVGYGCCEILLGCEVLYLALILLAVNHYISVVLVVGTVGQRVERYREGRLDSQRLLNGVVGCTRNLIGYTNLRDRTVELVATAQRCTTLGDVGCVGSLNHGNRLDLHVLVLGREGQVVNTELLISNLRYELQAYDALALGYGERRGGQFPFIGCVAGQR